MFSSCWHRHDQLELTFLYEDISSFVMILSVMMTLYILVMLVFSLWSWSVLWRYGHSRSDNESLSLWYFPYVYGLSLLVVGDIIFLLISEEKYLKGNICYMHILDIVSFIFS